MLKLWRLHERKYLKPHGQGRLLDFGCGGGSFLARMSRQGWEVTGLDVAVPCVERIRNDLHLPAHVGTLPHPEIRLESFDAITMWHSLEHVYDPARVLRQAYFHLVPGGKIFIAVPNIKSLAFDCFGRSWYGLDLPRHLTHFSPQTLRWMLERAGFEVGTVRMIRQSAWVRWSARLNNAGNPHSGWRRFLAGKWLSRPLAWYSCLSQRSDCMMVTATRRN
jgi:SAM-dependent methyltransferase